MHTPPSGRETEKAIMALISMAILSLPIIAARAGGWWWAASIASGVVIYPIALGFAIGYVKKGIGK